MKRLGEVGVAWVVLLMLIGCDQDEGSTGVKIPSKDGFELLSQYNLFSGDLKDLIPNQEVNMLPYDLNVPLFSDYALKKRFVYVPEGSEIPYDADNKLELPIGSVLVKHFYYDDDNYMETRLLIRREDGWQPETYKWNEYLSDASRLIAGETLQITADIDGEEKQFNYSIPNLNQCKNCHASDGELKPIGPEIANLNKDYRYEDGSENQIDAWMSHGILGEHAGADVPVWPAMDDLSADLNDRARAYLAINCSSCHRLDGAAANSGLYLEYDNEEELSLGYWKTPTAAGDGSGGLKYIIHPGNAEESILLYRMNSSEVEVRMPELGRELIHDEGVELIKEWINTLE